MSYDELMEKYKEGLSKINELEIKAIELADRNNDLADRNTDLVGKNAELATSNEKLKIEIENLKLENQNFKRFFFGSKRESNKSEEEAIDIEQVSLFTSKSEEEQEKEIQEEEEKQIEEITVYKKKNKKEKKAGIKRSNLKDVEIVRKEYVIEDEEDKKCPICNSELELIGKKVIRQEICFVPAKLEIYTYVQYVYKCKKCGTKESQKETPTIVKPQLPRPLLTHSFVSPSLATDVLYQKYYMGVPFYRQEKVWDDRGLILPRNMMANWAIKITEYYLQKLYELMYKEIKRNCILGHADETTIQCNKEKGRDANSKSYMWVFVTGENEEKQGVIFNYSQSRSGKTAQNFLRGFTGTLVTDGYEAYKDIEGLKAHGECWAHARRKFYEAVPIKNKELDRTAVGYKGVEFCDKLFKVEEEITKNNLNTEERLKIRKEKSAPILKNFYDWVYSMSEKIIVNSKLQKAIIYAKNQEKELKEFMNDGNIPLSNSRAERAIRPFAVHRKNWLFADSVQGGETNGVMYSFIESAKINKLNIYKYIKYLLEELPQLENPDESTLKKYLPWSKELPEEILNFQGTYEDFDLDKNICATEKPQV